MEHVKVQLPLRVRSDPQAWRLSQWLVKPGSAVYLKQPVAVLTSMDSGAIEHALAPHKGTLVRSCVVEGNVVDKSKDVIAEIEYCPHSVVFKGLCGVCGEDVETPHFAETSRQESRLPVAYNSKLLSVTRAEAESVSSGRARRLFESKRLSLVLDLDHTLVHATDDPRAAAVLCYAPQNADVLSVSSFTLGGTPEGGDTSLMHIKLRPNLAEFLARVAPRFELHIYTMGSRPYADRVAHLIDPNKKFFRGRITSREDFAEGRFNRKSIQRLFPCDDSMVLIVDDREDVWISGTRQTYMPNLIQAEPYSFWGGLHEAYDRASTTKFTTPVSTSKNLKAALPPFPPAVLHVNGNGEPLEKANLLSSSKRGVRVADNNKSTKRQSKVSLEERKVEKCSSSKLLDGGIVKTSGNETNGTGAVGLSGVTRGTDMEVSGGQGEVAKECKKKLQVQDVKREAKGDRIPTNQSLKVFYPGAQVSPTSTAFSEHFRRIVRNWWNADTLARSSQHLLRLAQVLEDCHCEFFRQAELIPAGYGAGNPNCNQLTNSFQAPTDIKDVLAEQRRRVLAGCVLTFTGVIPTGVEPNTVSAWNLALRLGAICSLDFINGRTTHVVTSSIRPANTQKCKEAMQFGTAFIVTESWLEDSALNFERQAELAYSERAQQRFKDATKFRNYVEDRFKDASRKFKKSSKIDLEMVSSKEEYLSRKRRKIEPMDKADGDCDLRNSTGEATSKVHVLSGDEIGEAMDSVFDD